MAPAIRAREALTDFVQQRVRPDRPGRADGSADADRRDSFHARSPRAGRQGAHSCRDDRASTCRRAAPSKKRSCTAGARRRNAALAGDRVRARSDDRASSDPSRKDARRSCSCRRPSGRSAARRQRHERQYHLAGQAPSAPPTPTTPTIYTFDPRGLDVNLRPSDVLQSLAENTGGRHVLEQRTRRRRCTTDRQERERVLPARLRAAEESRRRQVPQDHRARETARRRGARADRLLRADPRGTGVRTEGEVAEELPPEVAHAVSVLAARRRRAGRFLGRRGTRSNWRPARDGLMDAAGRDAPSAGLGRGDRRRREGLLRRAVDQRHAHRSTLHQGR